MELEEMKLKWMDMSAEIEKQKKLTDMLIMQMTQENYRRKLDKIRLPEFISAVICFLYVVYIIAKFEVLDNWYLVICGLITILILTILPLLSLRAISRMRSLKVTISDYRLLLVEHAKARLNFIRVQKSSLVLTFILLVVSVPLSVKLFGGRHVVPAQIWVIFYVLGSLAYYFVAIRVYRYYKRSATEAGMILEDLKGE